MEYEQIVVNNLTKEFYLRKRNSGIAGSLVGLFYASKETISISADKIHYPKLKPVAKEHISSLFEVE